LEEEVLALCIKVLIPPYFFESTHRLQHSSKMGFDVIIVAETLQDLQAKILECTEELDITIRDINLCSFWEGIILGIFLGNASTI
jgi:hypothetical protein